MQKVASPKIFEMIKKLLALATSPNKNESELAYKKAKKLMKQYGINEDEFKNKKIHSHETILVKESSIVNWEIHLAFIISKLTDTEIIINGINPNRIITIIGNRFDITCAITQYKRFSNLIIETSIGYKIVVKNINSFRRGMVNSIEKRLIEGSEKSNGKELIVIMNQEKKKENIEYLNNKYNNIEYFEYEEGEDPNSYHLGEIIGKKIDLSRSLKKINCS